MPIDTSGKWWKGVHFADLAEYVKLLTQEGYPAREVRQSVCMCGGKAFRLEVDEEEGSARRTCAKCGATAYIADSEEYAGESEFQTSTCPCSGDLFEIGVGFSFRDTGEVKWITVGERCVRCGILGSSVDWKIDYSPTDYLLTRT